jgi:protease-4
MDCNGYCWRFDFNGLTPRRPSTLSRVTLALLLCLAVVGLVGCGGGPHVRAEVNATGNVTTHLPPVANQTSVLPMAVPGGHGDAEGQKIAIIDVDGLLVNADFVGMGSMGENPVSLFRERLDAAAADPCVRAVVVRINTPGGGVTASDIMWHDLEAFKRRTGLPVVACLLDVGAGGGYYLATAADQIIAHPTSITGAVGVILNVYNMQDAMAQFNICGIPVKAGQHIDLGTPIAPMEEDKRALLQSMADQFHKRFREIVINSRPQVDPRLESNFDGRVFTAQQALDRHLIDGVGYLDDAIESARRMGGAPCAQVVLYHRCEDRPRTQYAITPNIPLQSSIMPVSMPGFDRSRLPGFLYLWQPDPTMEKLVGH